VSFDCAFVEKLDRSLVVAVGLSRWKSYFIPSRRSEHIDTSRRAAAGGILGPSILYTQGNSASHQRQSTVIIWPPSNTVVRT
jgi:hypothetical protein